MGGPYIAGTGSVGVQYLSGQSAVCTDDGTVCGRFEGGVGLHIPTQGNDFDQTIFANVSYSDGVSNSLTLRSEYRVGMNTFLYTHGGLNIRTQDLAEETIEAKDAFDLKLGVGVKQDVFIGGSRTSLLFEAGADRLIGGSTNEVPAIFFSFGITGSSKDL